MNKAQKAKGSQVLLNSISSNFDSNSINVVVTTNRVGDESYPMSPWIVLHRIGHHIIDDLRDGGEKQGEFGILLKEFVTIVQKYTNLGKNSLHRQILLPFIFDFCTFKSAKTKYMKNDREFLYELFAQYVKTGSVKFNFPSTGNGYTISDSNKLHSELRNYAIKCNFQFELALKELVGKVIVMN